MSGRGPRGPWFPAVSTDPLLLPMVWQVVDLSHPVPGLLPTGPAERAQPHPTALSQGHQRSKAGPSDTPEIWELDVGVPLGP